MEIFKEKAWRSTQMGLVMTASSRIMKRMDLEFISILEETDMKANSWTERSMAKVLNTTLMVGATRVNSSMI